MTCGSVQMNMKNLVQESCIENVFKNYGKFNASIFILKTAVTGKTMTSLQSTSTTSAETKEGSASPTQELIIDYMELLRVSLRQQNLMYIVDIMHQDDVSLHDLFQWSWDDIVEALRDVHNDDQNQHQIRSLHRNKFAKTVTEIAKRKKDSIKNNNQLQTPSSTSRVRLVILDKEQEEAIETIKSGEQYMTQAVTKIPELLDGLQTNTKRVKADLHALCTDIKQRIDEKERGINQIIDNIHTYKLNTLPNSIHAAAKSVNKFYSEYYRYLEDESLTKQDLKDKLLYAKQAIENEMEKTKQHQDACSMNIVMDKERIINTIRKCFTLRNTCLDIPKVTSLKFDGLTLDWFFEYERDFDRNGIIYFLGCDYGNDDWQNPSEKGIIQIQSTKIHDESKSIHHFVGREAARSMTNGEENAWFSIDFKGLQVKPTHYTLRHYISNDDYCLRNWDFEGSADGGKEWTIIRQHTNDTSLQGKGASHTWKVDECNAFYSLFRIRMTGKDSGGFGSWSLCCSGFEIYGQLKYIAPDNIEHQSCQIDSTNPVVLESFFVQ
eukprot:70606_1